MTFHLITIFPEIFGSYLDEGILSRAQEDGKVKIKIYNLRDFADDKRKTVDDTPYGGGPGMVLKVEPIHKCIERIKSSLFAKASKDRKVRVVLTSAKGGEYAQKKAEDLKKFTDIIIICGRYEGVDERVAKHIADEEISIGKYVLTGGELPAMVIVDSISRLLPEVLGNQESLKSESHKPVKSQKSKVKSQKDFPVYTKPAEFKGWKVPEVLQNGNHAEIEKWRNQKR